MLAQVREGAWDLVSAEMSKLKNIQVHEELQEHECLQMAKARTAAAILTADYPPEPIHTNAADWARELGDEYEPIDDRIHMELKLGQLFKGPFVVRDIAIVGLTSGREGEVIKQLKALSGKTITAKALVECVRKLEKKGRFKDIKVAVASGKITFEFSERDISDRL